MRIGKKSGSVALSADALNDAVDMCSGLVALIAVALAVHFPGMQSADHWGGFAVGLFVIFFGLRVVRETALQLMDTMPEGKADGRRSVPSPCASRGRSASKNVSREKPDLRYHVDLHLEVDPDLGSSARLPRHSHCLVRIAIKNDH